MKVLTAIAGILLLGASCLAQDASPSDQDSTQSIASAAMASRTKVKAEESKQDDIRRLLEVTGAAGLASQSMDEMEKSIKPLVENALPPGAYRAELVNLFFEKFRSKRDPAALENLIIPIYDKYYTDDDIKGLIQLYQTPLGQKMLSILPKVAAESQAAGEQWGEQVGRQAMLEVLSEHPDLEKALEQAKKVPPVQNP